MDFAAIERGLSDVFGTELHDLPETAKKALRKQGSHQRPSLTSWSNPTEKPR